MCASVGIKREKRFHLRLIAVRWSRKACFTLRRRFPRWVHQTWFRSTERCVNASHIGCAVCFHNARVNGRCVAPRVTAPLRARRDATRGASGGTRARGSHAKAPREQSRISADHPGIRRVDLAPPLYPRRHGYPRRGPHTRTHTHTHSHTLMHTYTREHTLTHILSLSRHGYVMVWASHMHTRCTHTHVDTHSHCSWKYSHTFFHTHTHTHTLKHKHTNAHTHTWMHTHTCSCTHSHTHTHTNTHTHTHTHTHTQS